MYHFIIICEFKLSYSPETKIWVVTSVTLTFDNVITPENFMMIRWWEHSQKGVTDGQTDRRTENTIHRAAWSQLKTLIILGPLKDFLQIQVTIWQNDISMKIWNSTKIVFAADEKDLTLSQPNFAHAKIMLLFWNVQTYAVIGMTEQKTNLFLFVWSLMEISPLGKHPVFYHEKFLPDV